MSLKDKFNNFIDYFTETVKEVEVLARQKQLGRKRFTATADSSATSRPQIGKENQ